MNGWLAGARIRLVQAADLSEAQRTAVANVASQFTQATGGTYEVEVVSTNSAQPVARGGEIVITNAGGCPVGAGGCALPIFNGSRLTSAYVRLLSETNVGGVYHELGHALVGFCHIDQGDSPPIAGNMSAMTGAGIFSEVDLRVIRSVYGSGLRTGASRSAFSAAGLIR